MATGQCANSRLHQLWPITHGFAGTSHGRWSVERSDERWRRAAPGSTPAIASAASATGPSVLTAWWAIQRISGSGYPPGPIADRRPEIHASGRPGSDSPRRVIRHRAGTGEALLL